MTEPFKAPAPVFGQRHDEYLSLVVSEFERWANARPGREIIVPPHKAGFTLFHNDHLANYQSAEEAIASDHWYHDDDWVSPEEKANAIATNQIWTAQWYPETPVGFCSLHASTLEALNVGLLAIEGHAG